MNLYLEVARETFINSTFTALVDEKDHSARILRGLGIVRSFMKIFKILFMLYRLSNMVYANYADVVISMKFSLMLYLALSCTIHVVDESAKLYRQKKIREVMKNEKKSK